MKWFFWIFLGIVSISQYEAIIQCKHDDGCKHCPSGKGFCKPESKTCWCLPALASLSMPQKKLRANLYSFQGISLTPCNNDKKFCELYCTNYCLKSCPPGNSCSGTLTDKSCSCSSNQND
jgi:hypothetical protein